MRELTYLIATYLIATSLDGRVSGPGDDASAFPLEGDHMPALVAEHPDTFPAHVHGMLRVTSGLEEFDTVVSGWSTYALAIPHGITSPYPHLRQYVASSHPRDVPGDITLTADPVATVRSLKAEDGGSGIWLCGGGLLASSLLDEIDRLLLKVNPVVLGSGPALFSHAYDARAFTLTSSRPFASGVVWNEYRRRDA